MHRSAPFTKTITGTGAAIHVDCGFKPKFVMIMNLTTLVVSMASDTMTSAHVVQVNDSGADTTNVLHATSNGITLRPKGFTIGTDADLNTEADVLHVIAW
jgi:hypothetical protein